MGTEFELIEELNFRKVEKQLEKLPEIFTEYYYALRAKKKSFGTVTEYLKSLKNFMDFVTAGETEPEFYGKVTTADINAYLLSIETKTVGDKTKPTSPGFRAGRLSALNMFFDFLVDTGRVRLSPLPRKYKPKEEDATTAMNT